MNVKISLFLIYVEAIIYLLLCNLHDCTFNFWSGFLIAEWLLNKNMLKIDNFAWRTVCLCFQPFCFNVYLNPLVSDIDEKVTHT